MSCDITDPVAPQVPNKRVKKSTYFQSGKPPEFALGGAVHEFWTVTVRVFTKMTACSWELCLDPIGTCPVSGQQIFSHCLRVSN
jgi:hypothetical protein